jgi:hypothetical protein
VLDDLTNVLLRLSGPGGPGRLHVIVWIQVQ